MGGFTWNIAWSCVYVSGYLKTQFEVAVIVYHYFVGFKNVSILIIHNHFIELKRKWNHDKDATMYIADPVLHYISFLIF